MALRKMASSTGSLSTASTASGSTPFAPDGFEPPASGFTPFALTPDHAARSCQELDEQRRDWSRGKLEPWQLQQQRRERERDAQVRGMTVISQTLERGQALLAADADTDSTRASTPESCTRASTPESWYNQREERLKEARKLKEEATAPAEAAERARVAPLMRKHAAIARAHAEEAERQREIRERAAEALALVHGAEHRPERLPRAVFGGPSAVDVQDLTPLHGRTRA